MPSVLMTAGAMVAAVGGQEPARPATSVVVAKSEIREMPTTVRLVGTLKPVRLSLVSSEVAGRVVDVPIREGDALKEGENICKLNNDLVSLRLKAAVASKEALQAHYEELLEGTRPEELARLKALLEERQAMLVRWTFEKERVEKLYGDQKAGSVREVYDAQAQQLAAKQQRIAAQAEYDKAVHGPVKQVITAAGYEVAQQQAVVDRLKNELEKTRIAAPFAGYVVNRVVELGDWVNEGGTVVSLADLSTVLVRVDVPETAIPYVHVGDQAKVKVDALQRFFSGVVKHRIPQADESARTFPVDIELDNSEQLLAAGMFARVTLVGGPRTKTVAVPKDAVLERGGTNYVTIVSAGRQGGMMGIPMPVTVGAEAGEWIAITSHNIQPGMQVVIRGNERVMFPSPVVVVDEHGTPARN